MVEEGFEERAASVVAAQAPRLFAAVITKDDDVEIVGWGMEFDDGAYMVTADGNNHYALAEAENALRYIRSREGTVQDLIWVVPASLDQA